MTDNKKEVKLVLRLPAELHSLLREKSYKEHVSMNKIINEVLEKELKNEDSTGNSK